MPKPKKPNKRNWEPREQRLVSEFIAQFYGQYESRTHVHLGGTPPRFKGMYTREETGRLLGVFRRWADAVVVMPDRIVLIEGKILPQLGVLSQLKAYERMVPNTPEYAEHATKPVEKVLVCAIEDSLITQLAREEGIRVVIFRPEWIEDYLKIVHPWEKTPGLGTLE